MFQNRKSATRNYFPVPFYTCWGFVYFIRMIFFSDIYLRHVNVYKEYYFLDMEGAHYINRELIIGNLAQVPCSLFRNTSPMFQNYKSATIKPIPGSFYSVTILVY